MAARTEAFVLLAARRVRNQHHLFSGLSSAAVFKWFHKFYLVVDRVVEQHKVYKVNAHVYLGCPAAAPSPHLRLQSANRGVDFGFLQLFGGAQGFMISTNVAEADADHATTMYRFLRHLLANLQHVSGRGCAPRGGKRGGAPAQSIVGRADGTSCKATDGPLDGRACCAHSWLEFASIGFAA
jgi:hypothetical protein